MKTLTRRARKKQQAFTGPHILVVDDEPNIGRLIKVTLERHNYQVRTAKDGIQALAIIKAACPDLLITDVMMPEMDGFELMEAVRSDIGLANLPILLLTARPADLYFNQEHEDVLGSGPTGECYLYKPFNPSKLVTAVHEMLRSPNLDEGKNV